MPGTVPALAMLDIRHHTGDSPLQDDYFTLINLFNSVMVFLALKISKLTFHCINLMSGPTSVQFFRSNSFVLSMKTNEIVGCCRKTLLARRMLRLTLLYQCLQHMQLRHVTHHPMLLRLLNCTKLSQRLSLLCSEKRGNRFSCFGRYSWCHQSCKAKPRCPNFAA